MYFWFVAFFLYDLKYNNNKKKTVIINLYDWAHGV